MQKAKLNIISIIAWSILTFICLFYLYSDHPEVETVQNNESTFLQNADSLINKMQQAGVMTGINEHFYTFDERSEWKRDMERACYELDKRILRFEKDSLKFSGELKDSLMTYIFSLKQKRDEIKMKIESEFNETDESKWEVFKSNVKTVWNEVEIYANRIVKKLNENKEHY